MVAGYTTYLFFMTRQPITYQGLHIVSFIILIITLTSLIFGSVMVCINNRKLLRLKQKYLIRSMCNDNYKKIFTTHQLLKFESITNTLLNQSLGFKLTNGITIISYTFITIIYNISTFFFLISQQIHLK
ncbi:hypothetical protein BLA29_003654 [Euroglyphus maynei]|uniref:Uncharacterized protein n=1 Tax=Euroglyphus maynei TaxID=6958 RepID=A0A1Y3ARI1_EURMA|nr:hypothetical protein BLA29_003654 [Euroglyphus maynei]